MATKSTDLKSALGQLEDLLELYLVKKAPFSIPTKWKEIIAQLTVWVNIIFIFFALPTILALIGLGFPISYFGYPFSHLGGINYGNNYILTLVFSVAILIVEALAIPGLFKRSEKGWRLLYYGVLLNALENLVTFNIGGLIIGGLISLYVLFQIKSYYK